MYSLGGLVVSADDDMRPYSLMEDSPESLEDHEISRGRLHKLGQNGFVRKSFDIMSAFLDVLGKPAAEVPDNYERGENLHDSEMELETNSSRGFSSENTIFLEPGSIQQDAIVKVAQTFRSGTNDIDAIDFVEMFLQDENQTSPEDLNDIYILVNFRPTITSCNWRMDCGVAVYDNTFFLHSSQRAYGSRTISIACGFSSEAWSPPMLTPHDTIPRAITCEIPRHRKSLTRKSQIFSRRRSSHPLRVVTNSA
jgi:hypothetical protein